jgi:hypothetical protein
MRRRAILGFGATLLFVHPAQSLTVVPYEATVLARVEALRRRGLRKGDVGKNRWTGQARVIRVLDQTSGPWSKPLTLPTSFAFDVDDFDYSYGLSPTLELGAEFVFSIAPVKRVDGAWSAKRYRSLASHLHSQLQKERKTSGRAGSP